MVLELTSAEVAEILLSVANKRFGTSFNAVSYDTYSLFRTARLETVEKTNDEVEVTE